MKGDINRYNITIKVRKETPVSFLKVRVSKKNTLERFMVQFSDLRTNIPNKTSTTKYLGFNRKQVFRRKEGNTRNTTIKHRKGHLVD